MKITTFALIVCIATVVTGALLIVTMGDETPTPTYVLADPECRPFLAIPGQPCPASMYLDAPSDFDRTPRPATCACTLVKRP